MWDREKISEDDYNFFSDLESLGNVKISLVGDTPSFVGQEDVELDYSGTFADSDSYVTTWLDVEIVDPIHWGRIGRYCLSIRPSDFSGYFTLRWEYGADKDLQDELGNEIPPSGTRLRREEIAEIIVSIAQELKKRE